MSNNGINWKRVKSALFQAQRQSEVELENDFDCLEKLIEICGEASQNRKMIIKIGKKLLFTENLTVVAPCCPDYTHENGSYTFHGLNGGVSLLTLEHIEFLKKVSKLFPKIKPIFLIADAEANDIEICQAVMKNKEEFLGLVNDSLLKTKEMMPLNWQVQLMTEAIPNLVEKELLISEQIRNDKKLSQRIITEMHYRAEMYRKIRYSLTTQEMVQRTIRTAAQYVAFGEYADQQGYLICNHTTTNLSWYLQTQAAFLHNPTSIY